MQVLTNTYFSGAGLMDIGLEAGGLTLQQSFEIDGMCCDTMRYNFSHEVVQCDITQKLVHAEKECHVMVATSVHEVLTYWRHSRRAYGR